MPEFSWGPSEYLMFAVLRELDRQSDGNRPVPKTEFHKICYLVDEELLRDNIDIKLPRYWYRFGGIIAVEVVETSMLREEPFGYQDYEGYDVSIDPKVVEGDFNVDRRARDAIDETVARVVSEFDGEYGISRIQDEQYLRFAPEEFITVFHEFRTALDEIAETGDDTRYDELREDLGELLRAYPDKYSRMHDEFLEWEHLTRQLLQLGRYDDVNRFAKEFWDVFSKIELRIRHNEHLPEWLVNRWRNQIVDNRGDFERELTRYGHVVRSNRSETDHLDAVADSYSETIWKLFNEG